MQLRFWGVRGSTPTPTASNLRYGGNTPCLELRTKSGNLFILDCGTGIRPLGHALEKEFGKKPIKARIFLTHYHWDHIQGIPFFTPLYHPQNQFLFHSYEFYDGSVQQALEEQMTDPYFPVDMSTMRAHRHFFKIEQERIAYDELVLRSTRLNHPQRCLGYRIERIATEVKAKQLVLFHHDPDRDDKSVDKILKRAPDHFDDVVAAKEGLLLKI